MYEIGMGWSGGAPVMNKISEVEPEGWLEVTV
jgi:hypothetical protein